MCFVPIASLVTATTEFGVSAYLFKRIKDKRLYPVAFFVLLLGLYQFTEFMLCRSDTPILWARVGFATYTFMPVLLYHFFMNIGGGKANKYVYLIPGFFSVLALFYPGFISYTSCNLLHVTVQSLVFNKNIPLMFVYMVYYFFFPIKGVYFFSRKTQKKSNFKVKLGVLLAPLALLGALLFFLWSTIFEANQTQTWLHTSVLMVVGILVLLALYFLARRKNVQVFYMVNSLILATVGVVIVALYFLLPSITLEYSSIFCQFALLYTAAAVLLVDALDGSID